MRIKKILSFVLMFALLAAGASVTLAGCGSHAGKLSADMFKGYKVDFNNAIAIGISQSKSSENANVSASIKSFSVGAQNSLTESSKNKFITIDAQNVAKEVVFQQINGGDEIKQDDIDAEIDKVYVTDNFIYFSLTTEQINRSNNNNTQYDQTDYICNDRFAQSFVIDRTTGKVYSLAEIGHIYFIENNIIQANDTFYALSIVGENAVFTDLVPNKNINAGYAYVDKDGMVFVDNNAVNQITDNVVYVTSGYNGGEGYSSGIGSDGRFYRVTLSYFVNTEIHVFDNSIKQWVAPIFDDTLIINHNEYAYYGNGYGQWVYTHYTFLNDSHSYRESIFAPNDKATNSNIEIIDTNIFKLENGSVKMYAFDDYSGNALEWLPKAVTIPNGVVLNTFDGMINNVIYATGHTATTTSSYQIYIDDDGNPKCELLSYEEYNVNIIVLQPLN